jgi:hypothetical protein
VEDRKKAIIGVSREFGDFKESGSFEAQTSCIKG